MSAEAIEQAIQRDLAWPLQRQRLAAWLAVDENPPVWPSLTAAVCTRNRPDDVARCVTALLALDYPGKLEILVVDNAPSDDRTMDLVRAAFPQVRYVRESRPGLDWARNRAILEAHGEILAYTDDDVVVDRFWARELARTFALNPGVMAITGLVEPLELETPAQQAFEQYGGFGRGMIQRWYGINRVAGERAAAEHTATGKYGTGANMAYRRSLFDRIGGFDPALDVGTISNGGGDLEMFYRVIKAGFPLVYEPRAIVWHRHRTDEAHFLTQITNNGVGFYAYLERCAAHFPDERLPIVRQGIWWYWYIYRYLLSFVRPVNTTRPVIRAELRGGIMGLGRYRKARRTAQRLARPGDLHDTLLAPAQTRSDLKPHAVAVRMIDLAERLGPISDVDAYPTTRVLVQFHGRLLGTLVIANLYQPISAIRLRDALLDQLGARLSPLLASPRWGEESRLLASPRWGEESRLLASSQREEESRLLASSQREEESRLLASSQREEESRLLASSQREEESRLLASSQREEESRLLASSQREEESRLLASSQREEESRLLASSQREEESRLLASSQREEESRLLASSQREEESRLLASSQREEESRLLVSSQREEESRLPLSSGGGLGWAATNPLHHPKMSRSSSSAMATRTIWRVASPRCTIIHALPRSSFCPIRPASPRSRPPPRCA
nr:glycosyltransferase [Oscillochloris trichoides]